MQGSHPKKGVYAPKLTGQGQQPYPSAKKTPQNSSSSFRIRRDKAYEPLSPHSGHVNENGNGGGTKTKPQPQPKNYNDYEKKKSLFEDGSKHNIFNDDMGGNSFENLWSEQVRVNMKDGSFQSTKYGEEWRATMQNMEETIDMLSKSLKVDKKDIQTKIMPLDPGDPEFETHAQVEFYYVREESAETYDKQGSYLGRVVKGATRRRCMTQKFPYPPEMKAQLLDSIAQIKKKFDAEKTASERACREELDRQNEENIKVYNDYQNYLRAEEKRVHKVAAPTTFSNDEVKERIKKVDNEYVSNLRKKSGMARKVVGKRRRETREVEESDSTAESVDSDGSDASQSRSDCDDTIYETEKVSDSGIYTDSGSDSEAATSEIEESDSSLAERIAAEKKTKERLNPIPKKPVVAPIQPAEVSKVTAPRRVARKSRNGHPRQ